MSKSSRINDKKNVNSYDAATTTQHSNLRRSNADLTSVPLKGRDDRPNTIPKGNKASRRCAVVESCPPSEMTGINTKHNRYNMPSQKYYYPVEYLHQPSFTGDYGPVISASVLIDPKFKSPLLALLNKLKREGHMVDGCIAELKALRQSIADYDRVAMRVMMLRAKPRN